VTDAEMEKKLLAHGFTEKEVNRLKKILTSEHAKDENLQSMVLDLKQKFIPCCVFLGTIPLLYPLIVTEPNRIEITGYLMTVMLILFSINLVIPIKLSFKAYFFLKKQK
jgi:hypothetical protein